VKILFDENIPRPLKQFFDEHEVSTVQDAGWTGIENGELLEKANSNYEIFILADKNLRYQQNLKNQKITIIEVPTNRWPILKQIAPKIVAALDSAKPGSYITIEE